MRHRAGFVSACLLGTLLVGLPSPGVADTDLAVEVELGRNGGMTPYLRNVVYTESQVDTGRRDNQSGRFQPYLADERSGWGSAIDARLVADTFQAGLSFRWFNISTARVHHAGTAPGRPNGDIRRSRIRPDETVDDSGVEYSGIEDRTVSIDPSRQSTLLVMGAEAGYRFTLHSGTFDVFAPVVGSLVVAHVAEKFAPFRPGLAVESGVSAAFDFVSIMKLLVGARMHAMATPTYWNRSDSARRAAELGRSTESALFATQISGSIQVGLQFELR